MCHQRDLLFEAKKTVRLTTCCCSSGEFHETDREQRSSYWAMLIHTELQCLNHSGLLTPTPPTDSSLVLWALLFRPEPILRPSICFHPVLCKDNEKINTSSWALNAQRTVWEPLECFSLTIDNNYHTYTLHCAPPDSVYVLLKASRYWTRQHIFILTFVPFISRLSVEVVAGVSPRLVRASFNQTCFPLCSSASPSAFVSHQEHYFPLS